MGCHTRVSTSHWLPTHQSYPRTVLVMNLTLFKKLPTPALKPKTKWSNVTQEMVNIWLVASCTVVMLCQKMLTLLLVTSKQRELFNSLIGAQLVLRLVSTTKPQQLFQAQIKPVLAVPSVCSPTPPLFLRHGTGSTENSI